MKSRLLMLILAVFIAFNFTGCAQAPQLHERLIIQGVGIDKTGSDYLVTLHVFNAAEATSEEGINQVQIMSEKGKSVSDAINNITNQIGKFPLCSQNMIVVIGEDTAKQGINNVMDFFVRYYESRPLVEVVIARGKARDVMTCKINDQLVSATKISELTKSENLSMGIMTSNVMEFVGRMRNETSEPSCAVVSLEGDGDNKIIKATGTAIFKNGKLVDFLNDIQTKGALLISKNAKNGTEVVNIPNVGNATYSILRSKSKINASIVNNKPVFDIKIQVDADIYEIDNTIYTTLGNNYFDIMENELRNQLAVYSEKAIDKAIRKNKSDIFDFGKHLLNKQPVYFVTKLSDWDNIMQDSSYNVSVYVNIDHSGQEANPI